MAIDWTLLVSGLSKAAQLARFFRAQGGVYAAKNAVMRWPTKHLHVALIHRMRRLAMIMQQSPTAPEAAEIAFQIANESRRLMCRMLEIEPSCLHSCIKVMAASADTPDDDKVATWVRSEPFDDRPVEQGPENAHLVKGNSVWASMFGRSDGVTNWRQFRCFSCNDLHKWPNKFVCDRQNWQRYYRSALVFPIRYPKDALGTECEHIGFLAFDSARANVFRGLPDIFDFADDPAGYSEQLETSTVFHLGSVLVDVLGTFLSTPYDQIEQNRSKNGEPE